MSIRKMIAAVSAAALVGGATLVGAPTAHATLGGIGVGIVEILGGTQPGCNTTGCPGVVGTGVVVDNPWSTNEVMTDAHVVDPILAAHDTIWIYEPYTETWMAGYVQREDKASDLAVLWIYDPNQAWPTAAPTFATTPLSNANPNNGTLVFAEGSSNNPAANPPATFATHNGTIVNNNYNGPDGTGVHCGGYTLYNMIRTDPQTTLHGDSGGPMYDSTANTNDPNRGKVIGLGECVEGDGLHSEGIQIGWAYWDLLNTRP